MNEEKKMILNMLQEGKISVEEAENLLNAIDGKSKGDSILNDFTNKITGSVEKALSKAANLVNNIDFDDLIDNSKKFVANFSLSYENEQVFEDEIDSIKVDIPNADVKIEKSQDNKVKVEEKIYIKNKFASSDFLDYKLEDKNLNIGLKNIDNSKEDFRVKLFIKLPRNSYENVEVNTVNGYFMLKNVDFNDINIKTVNGETIVENTTSNIKTESVNGGLVAKNINGNVDFKAINGSLKLFSVVGGYLKGECTNGRLKLDSINLDQVEFKSQNGSIDIENIKDSSNMNLETGTSSIRIDTTGFDSSIKAFVKSRNVSISEKFKNRIENNGIYEVSNGASDFKLNINAKSNLGDVVIK